jgi:putative oxidoreductase
MGVGRLILRATVGGYFVGHGMQKLAGWFGGGGPEQTGQMFESVGLRPGRRHAIAAGVAEAGGGTLLVFGLATPAAAAMLTGVMVTAIRHVHWRKGPWNTNGGYELNLGLLASLAAVAETGPGPLSLDARLGLDRHGDEVALAVLAVGAAGSALASELGKRGLPAPQPAAQPAPEPEPVNVRTR